MSAGVTALCPARDQCGEQPVLEKPALGFAPRAIHLGHHPVGQQDVPHDDIVFPGHRAAVRFALGAGVHRAASMPVDDADLAVVEMSVGFAEFLDDLLGRIPKRQ